MVRGAAALGGFANHTRLARTFRTQATRETRPRQGPSGGMQAMGLGIVGTGPERSITPLLPVNSSTHQGSGRRAPQYGAVSRSGQHHVHRYAPPQWPTTAGGVASSFAGSASFELQERLRQQETVRRMAEATRQLRRRRQQEAMRRQNGTPHTQAVRRVVRREEGPMRLSELRARGGGRAVHEIMGPHQSGVLFIHRTHTPTPTPRGLPPGMVELLPCFPEGRSDQPADCVVCLCPMQQEEEVMLLPCAHKFHAACIRPWLGRSIECPVCKANVPDLIRQQQVWEAPFQGGVAAQHPAHAGSPPSSTLAMPVAAAGWRPPVPPTALGPAHGEAAERPATQQAGQAQEQQRPRRVVRRRRQQQQQEAMRAALAAAPHVVPLLSDSDDSERSD